MSATIFYDAVCGAEALEIVGESWRSRSGAEKQGFCLTLCVAVSPRILVRSGKTGYVGLSTRPEVSNFYDGLVTRPRLPCITLGGTALHFGEYEKYGSCSPNFRGKSSQEVHT